MQHGLIFSLSKTCRGRFWICKNSLVRRISPLSLITSQWGFTVKAGGSLQEHCENTGEKTLPLPWNLAGFNVTYEVYKVARPGGQPWYRTT